MDAATLQGKSAAGSTPTLKLWDLHFHEFKSFCKPHCLLLNETILLNFWFEWRPGQNLSSLFGDD